MGYEESTRREKTEDAERQRSRAAQQKEHEAKDLAIAREIDLLVNNALVIDHPKAYTETKQGDDAVVEGVVMRTDDISEVHVETWRH